MERLSIILQRLKVTKTLSAAESFLMLKKFEMIKNTKGISPHILFIY